jgi:thiamine-phosphate pyrophosphorylase
VSDAPFRGLYAVTPETIDTDGLVARVRDAVAGGAVMVQYRCKFPDSGLRRVQALRLLALCREAGAPLIINDDVALAEEIGADGVHLGRDDEGLSAARARLGGDALVGASCYGDLVSAETAARAGASYVAFGAAFASITKPDAVHAPAALYRQARQRLRVTIVAIGGIRVDNAETLLAAGVDLLAVISDLFGARDVAARAAQYAALFDVR